MSGGIVNLFVVYQFLKRLVKPFDEWDAYEHGIIDDKGNILRKSRDFKTKDERDSFRMFDRLVLRLKKLLEKIPGGRSRIASYGAALWLIKEHESGGWENLTDNELEQSFTGFLKEHESVIADTLLYESDNPTNVASPDAIAGLDATHQKKKKKKKMDDVVIEVLRRKGWDI